MDRERQGRTSWILLAIIAAIAGLFAFQLWEVDTTIAPSLPFATPVSQPLDQNRLDAEVIIRSNERLLEMAKWTIALVFSIGALLVGFSWFQHERTIDRDRQTLDRHQRRIDNQVESRMKEVADVMRQFKDQLNKVDALERGRRSPERNRAYVTGAKLCTSQCCSIRRASR